MIVKFLKKDTKTYIFFSNIMTKFFIVNNIIYTNKIGFCNKAGFIDGILLNNYNFIAIARIDHYGLDIDYTIVQNPVSHFQYHIQDIINNDV